ncbi:shufflon system plasmid conjugative transfer pilus tip adhesin PilV [Noviherbaspirillum sp.]|jgi:prepilin-type N-terminal cleavage/methylation domain-containing protein|uniref:shufflon system plasmid conjugative transfer pilus tip adhesin PilV n=1 Tax=Noviherbaspirillum sp. TaxID=1926288 RepID=UPI0025FF01A1|nr:shufflon system plasmid conjugative transfer pilus tip adhesin PilV [Noviherbaspirillum sp.]
MMKRNEHGFTLIELLASLAIGAAMLIGLNAMVDTSIKDMKAQQAAAYQAQVTDAAAKYISENYGTLATAANTVVTTAVPMSTLVAGGFLPSSFLPSGGQPTNAYGQTPCLLFRADTRTSGANTVYVLNALVVTEGSAAQRIQDGEISVVAANAGKGAGAITARTPNVAQGAFGSWQIDGTTSPTLADFQSASCSGNVAGQGSLASALFFDGPDQLLTEYLYRSAVPGRPELNTMNTPLQLGSAAIVTEGSSCNPSGAPTPPAALAADASNNLMYCDSATGNWAVLSLWKSPVPDYNSLPSTASRDEVRMVSNLNRAFTYNGSSWVALAVDQIGNMKIPGNLDVGTIAATGNIATNSSVLAGLDVSANGNMKAAGNVRADKTVSGNEVVADLGVYGHALTLTDGLSTNGTLNEGSPCHLGPFTNTDGKIFYQWPEGTTIVNKNGITMNCAVDDHRFHYQNYKIAP